MHVSLAISINYMYLFHSIQLTVFDMLYAFCFLFDTISTHHAQPQSSGSSGMVYFGAPASAHSSDAQSTSSQSSQVHCHVRVCDEKKLRNHSYDCTKNTHSGRALTIWNHCFHAHFGN